MSGSPSAPATAGTPARDYDEMMDALDVAIEQAREKVESGRIYDVENSKARVKWIRALAYTVNVKRQVQNDAELAELHNRVEKLEEAQ